MSALHQLGHDCRNLLKDPNLKMFRGSILSPMDYDESKTAEIVRDLNTLGLKSIFDPQVYFPKPKKRNLGEWGYFPKEAATYIPDNVEWYVEINRQLVGVSKRLPFTEICSPCRVSRRYDDEYYAKAVEIADDLAQKLTTDTSVLLTLIVDLSLLASDEDVFRICDIVTKSKLNGVYLLLYSNLPGRKELSNQEQVLSVMKLIHILKLNKMSVTVGYASSDVILWKYAGADYCATGKFHNLRRFNNLRWEDIVTGGAMLPYYFSNEFMAFFRKDDMLRLNEEGLLQAGFDNLSSEFLLKAETNSPKNLIKIGWLLYLRWFGTLAQLVDQNQLGVKDYLLRVKQTWSDFRSYRIPLTESENTGFWVESWYSATQEFDRWARRIIGGF